MDTLGHTEAYEKGGGLLLYGHTTEGCFCSEPLSFLAALHIIQDTSKSSSPSYDIC